MEHRYLIGGAREGGCDSRLEVDGHAFIRIDHQHPEMIVGDGCPCGIALCDVIVEAALDNARAVGRCDIPGAILADAIEDDDVVGSSA